MEDEGTNLPLVKDHWSRAYTSLRNQNHAVAFSSQVRPSINATGTHFKQTTAPRSRLDCAPNNLLLSWTSGRAGHVTLLRETAACFGDSHTTLQDVSSIHSICFGFIDPKNLLWRNNTSAVFNAGFFSVFFGS